MKSERKVQLGLEADLRYGNDHPQAARVVKSLTPARSVSDALSERLSPEVPSTRGDYKGSVEADEIDLTYNPF